MIANHTRLIHIIGNDTEAGDTAFVAVFFFYQHPFFILFLVQLEGERLFRQLAIEPLTGGEAGGHFIRRVFIFEDCVRGFQRLDTARVVHLLNQDPALRRFFPDLVGRARGNVLEGSHFAAAQGDIDAAIGHGGGGFDLRPMRGQRNLLGNIRISLGRNGEEAILIRIIGMSFPVGKEVHLVLEIIEAVLEGVILIRADAIGIGHAAVAVRSGLYLTGFEFDRICFRRFPAPSAGMARLAKQLGTGQSFPCLLVVPLAIVTLFSIHWRRWVIGIGREVHLIADSDQGKFAQSIEDLLRRV